MTSAGHCWHHMEIPITGHQLGHQSRMTLKGRHEDRDLFQGPKCSWAHNPKHNPNQVTIMHMPWPVQICDLIALLEVWLQQILFLRDFNGSPETFCVMGPRTTSLNNEIMIIKHFEIPFHIIGPFIQGCRHSLKSLKMCGIPSCLLQSSLLQKHLYFMNFGDGFNFKNSNG